MPKPLIYKVKCIVGKTVIEELVHYRVRWRGYSAKEDTWEPIQHLQDVMNLVQEFEKCVWWALDENESWKTEAESDNLIGKVEPKEPVIKREKRKRSVERKEERRYLRKSRNRPVVKARKRLRQEEDETREN